MLSRFVRIIIVNGAIVIMMMLYVSIVRRFMRQCCDVSGQHTAPLHGKAMQWEAHEQENAEKSSHGCNDYISEELQVCKAGTARALRRLRLTRWRHLWRQVTQI
jgi:hypothetical protein